jgi:hypothetical protein
VGVEQVALPLPHVHVAVVVRGDADVHPGVRARQPLGHLPALLERLPGHRQQEAVLGVHLLRLARRDAEEVGVEAVDVGNETTPAAVDLARRRGVRVIDVVDVEALRWQLGDRVDTVAEQPPEGLRRVGAAGQAAADADDRDVHVSRPSPPRPDARGGAITGRCTGCRTRGTDPPG